MPASRATPSADSPLVLPALEALAGPVLLIDAQQRVTVATPEAQARLGSAAVRPGTPLAEALPLTEGTRGLEALLFQGRQVEAPLHTGGRVHVMQVRALALSQGARRLGWVVLLGAETETEGSEENDAEETFHGMWTRDAGMKRLFRIVEKVARTESSVLVRGESGTGKELVANALHAISERRKGPFRAINCAALPPSLLESELFGHVRGAFTGAVRDSPGHFRLADKGTLFLDEVGDMPLELQGKLLRVLETHTVIPVGGRAPVPVNVRIVAATHRPLRREVEAGRFRADLMYRLRVVPLFLPSLRERRGDILPLARRFLDELEQSGTRRVERFSPGARRLLESHGWPGNVRELRNVMEYAYVIGEGPVLHEADLPPEFSEPRPPPAPSEPARRTPPPEFPSSAGEDHDPATLRAALARAGGNRTEAARMLGISRVTLWRRLRAAGNTGKR
ncbi:sigma-54-dependent Fis family transcriptional regulator [Vitiosangium sp. GDMCC 1.1324]|uniref:sigma-54 interaction domain-containing protein n=1 Tax=Vitiosangium sp. (strain GDMCC 1.1324) TaxID=2138576 RepID=UPI000D36EECF|nr:sigma 54-interacting transcriptional regulator [Vitiosangium sp. GDMCC 1.1324]PTL84905.1 AAA family ATPase [Vitiosangium sp. GDMCC 1.1324]